MAVRDHDRPPLLDGAADDRLTLTVGWYQTRWYRTGREEHLRLTKFFGKLMLINVAMGVVTGIVHEFQFGVNWADSPP